MGGWVDGQAFCGSEPASGRRRAAAKAAAALTGGKYLFNTLRSPILAGDCHRPGPSGRVGWLQGPAGRQQKQGWRLLVSSGGVGRAVARGTPAPATVHAAGCC